MARTQPNPILSQLRGSIGDVVFKQYGDRIVVSKKPDLSGHEPTPAQKAQRERFRQATRYAREAMADPAARAVYEKLARPQKKPPHTLAVGDWLNAPIVESIELRKYDGAAGSEIAVAARDDVRVVAVTVTLAEEGGGEIEAGAAHESPPGSGRWLYTASAEARPGAHVRVTARAVDRPGNVAEATVVYAAGA
jgi:hypothetical protein